MQVDPEMEFSGSESSDFEDVYQVKEDEEVKNTAKAALKESNGQQNTVVGTELTET